ncbi:MAG: TonB family protein [Burkholderiaceae bacterium]|nr:TonB family protein [Burkholderiaceae bacterium]
MSAMTFESASASPRRAAVRRGYRPASGVVAVKPTAPIVASVAGDIRKSRNLLAWGGAVGIALVLHAVALYIVNQPVQVAPLPRKLPELVMDIAPPPPPPPPPEVKPKIVPRVVAVKPAAPPPVSIPVVQNAPEVSEPTPNAVPVAVAPPPVPVAAPTAPPEPLEPKAYTGGFVVKPELGYPSAGYKKLLRGKVTLKIHVQPNGQPDVVTVVTSSGFDIFDDVAVKGYKAAVFEPAMRGKTPTDGLYIVSVNFKPS